MASDTLYIFEKYGFKRPFIASRAAFPKKNYCDLSQPVFEQNVGNLYVGFSATLIDSYLYYIFSLSE